MKYHNDAFKPGLLGFEILYFDLCRKQFVKSLKMTVLFTLLTFGVVLVSDKELLNFIDVIASIGIDVTPDVLGFTIAGYAMIIGLSNTKAMDTLKEFQLDNGISMFQQLNTTFIAMLLSALLNLLLCIVAKVILSAEISTSLCEWMIVVFNGCSFILLLMSTYYVVFSIKDLLSNLFSLGQYLQLVK